jgi:hypothetical protein
VGTTRGTSANAFALINENASATNPTILPNRADEDSGIGQNAVDQVSIIAGGIEIARAVEDTVEQFIISPGAILGSAALPSLAFGDGDSGFREISDDALKVTLAGVDRWTFTEDRFVGVVGNGPSLQNEASTATNPTLIPALGDTGTGIGGVTGALNVIVQSVNAMQFDEAGGVITIRAEGVVHGFLGTVAAPGYAFRLDSNTGMYSGGAGSDELKFSAGGVQALSLNELNSGVIQAHQANVAITAFATGGQGSATQLDESYNVLSVVATTGDSVKLPPVFAIDSVMYIKNDGANAADVFPASGDDLGAGVDTAVSLAAGASISFIATVANATWTQWIVSAGGGGGDVTKVGTPVDNQVGIWTGDGTIEGDTALTFDAGVLASTRVRVGDGTDAAPAYSFTGETDLGFRRVSAGLVSFVDASSDQWFFSSLAISANTATGAGLRNEAASATNPTFLPNRSDADSGIGQRAVDEVSIIAGGVEGIRITEVAGVLQVLVPAGIEASPSYSFINDPNTGLINETDIVTMVLGGTRQWIWTAAAVGWVTTGRAQLRNEVPSATNPVFVPSGLDQDTGIGSAAADQLSLIGGGVEIARAVEASGANQFIIAPGVVQNAAATPSLAFGDGNTGFFESIDNTLKISIGNAARWQFQANNFLAENSAGPFLFNTAGTSATVPIMGPNRGDNNTGLGHGAEDQLDLIAGGLDCITIREVGAAREIGFYSTTPTAQQTGVAVSAAAIHAALVTLGLITA